MIEYVFFLNLPDAVERRHNMEKRFPSALRWEATGRDKVPKTLDERMVSRYNIKRHKHLARCGCFMSHYTLLKHIVENKLNNVLILEDDAVLHDDSVKLEDIEIGKGLTYLGGYFHPLKMTSKDIPEVISREGLNRKSSDFRIIMMLSYAISDWQFAAYILNYIDSQNRFRAIDIMVHDFPVKQYYIYPALIVDSGDVSQIDPELQKVNSTTNIHYRLKKHLK